MDPLHMLLMGMGRSEEKKEPMSEEEAIKKAAELIYNSKNARTVVFSGAGISVESGIPDFRSPGGLWEKYKPEIYANYGVFLREPEKFWEMSAEVEKMFEKVAPNAAHEALAQLEALDKVHAIITQNIDNLHQAAGSKKVYELHGNAKSASCIQCAEKFPEEDIRACLKEKKVPRCKKCDGLVKTDVILFGEALPRKVIEGAMEEAQNSQLVVMIGSSLLVSPANLIPMMAKASGAKLLFINKDPTPLDHLADVIVSGKAGDLLPKIVEAYKARAASKM